MSISGVTHWFMADTARMPAGGSRAGRPHQQASS
jgi:hypothetical protein